MAYRTLKLDIADNLIFSLSMIQSRLTRGIIASGLSTTGLIFTLTSGGVNWKLAVAIPAVLLGTALNWRTPPKPVLWSFYVIAASAFATTFFITGEALLTHIVGMALLLPFGLLIFNGSKLDDVMKWVLPFAFLHAVVAVWQGVTGDGRAVGLTTNPNYAAGFLVIVAAWMLVKQHGIAVFGLMLALMFTESRLAIGVMLLVGVPLAWQIQHRDSKTIALYGLALLLVQWIVLFLRPADNPADIVTAAAALESDITYRLQGVSWPGLWGTGWWSQYAHNVPIKMALEWGILAGLAWIIITAWVLWQRPRVGASWWVLVALVGLSMLDFYTFTPIMAGWWWLVIARPKMLQSNKSQ